MCDVSTVGLVGLVVGLAGLVGLVGLVGSVVLPGNLVEGLEDHVAPKGERAEAE